uniref:Retrotransposon protein, putative, Ty3-gypsy subclass n=1 Tax=Oryza sativa subsp. japonica TaxID=39947 RepID=Q2QTI0_ORYSJ|nr:retrotransposon protein, putative, Ty3-gypsy subclass [Oryza sativa Japonica Group]
MATSSRVATPLRSLPTRVVAFLGSAGTGRSLATGPLRRKSARAPPPSSPTEAEPVRPFLSDARRRSSVAPSSRGAPLPPFLAVGRPFAVVPLEIHLNGSKLLKFISNSFELRIEPFNLQNSSKIELYMFV